MSQLGRCSLEHGKVCHSNRVSNTLVRIFNLLTLQSLKLPCGLQQPGQHLPCSASSFAVHLCHCVAKSWCSMRLSTKLSCQCWRCVFSQVLTTNGLKLRGVFCFDGYLDDTGMAK